MSYNLEYDLLSCVGEHDSRPKVYQCKGLFFRGYRNLYAQGEEIHLKTGFRLLKRMSCTGCEQCDHYSDHMNDMLGYGSYSSVEFPDEIKHGGLYTLRVGNCSRDEYGNTDDWDYIFEEVKDAKTN